MCVRTYVRSSIGYMTHEQLNSLSIVFGYVGFIMNARSKRVRVQLRWPDNYHSPDLKNGKEGENMDANCNRTQIPDILCDQNTIPIN